MKEYLENILHQPVEVSDFNELNKLPLVYRGSFSFHVAETDGSKFLIVVPIDGTNLTDLRRQQRQIEIYTGFRCALYLKKLNSYSRDRMLEEGIPFIWENHQVYLPFLGFMLNPAETRELKPCEQVSFLTQKLLLSALYGNWHELKVTQAAEALDVSKMSVTRCFDEIEILDIPVLQLKNRARKIVSAKNRKLMWKTIKPFLRNPVIRTFRLAEQIEKPLVKSGFSALSEYSMLEVSAYPTYAVTKADLSASGIMKMKPMALGELPKCVIHELGYSIPAIKQGLIDPLSLALILSDEEKHDPRVEKAIKQMLEEYVW